MKRILAVLALLLLPTSVFGATVVVNLAWDANTEPDLTGYKLYQSRTCAEIVQGATPVQTLGLVTATSVVGLIDGSYAWKLTAFDSVGNESGFSNCVTFQSDTTPPAPPQALRISSTVVVQ